jgi:hypothetical protein
METTGVTRALNPCRAPPHAPHHVTGHVESDPRANGILVAEDDGDIAALIAYYMQKAGWKVHLTAAGDEALAYAVAHGSMPPSST